jgi:hypothetical protein
MERAGENRPDRPVVEFNHGGTERRWKELVRSFLEFNHGRTERRWKELVRSFLEFNHGGTERRWKELVRKCFLLCRGKQLRWEVY